mmetsp:Transcript_2767/g.7584  ORF Transcript_2767/g.7584 Transcript_2767/m.7584 type:complete len:260 (+) Transcript_2767:801-1580(+)
MRASLACRRLDAKAFGALLEIAALLLRSGRATVGRARRRSFCVRMERKHLFPQQLPQLLLVELLHRLRLDGVVEQIFWRERLIFGIVVVLQVRMRERLGGGDARRRVELEHARHQVERAAVLDAREYVRKWPLRLFREVLQKFERALAGHVPYVLRSGLAGDVADELELVLHVLARKQHTAREHLAHDAAYRPHVDAVRVVVAQNQLRSAIPARDNVVRLLSALLRVKVAREPKVADLQIAVCVHENVGRLEVAVQHVC